ncbi:MAG: ATP-binding protein [Sinimarinibacterium sp.]
MAVDFDADVWIGGVAIAALMLFWVFVLRREVRRRRASEAQIVAAERLLREVTDGIPGSVVFQFERSADGVLRTNFVSSGVEALTGVRREDALRDYGQVLTSVVEEDRGLVLTAIEKSAHSMQPYVVEYRVRDRSGEIEWIRGSAEPSARPDGRIVWNGFSTRISQLKHVQDEIRAAKRLLQQVTDGIPGGVFQLRRGADGQIELLFVNSGMRRLTGDVPSEGPPSIANGLGRLQPEDRALVVADIEASARSLQPAARDIHLTWPDGSVHWIHLAAVPRAGDDGDIIWNGYAIDVSERKLLENDLQRTRAHIVELAQNLPGVVYQSCLYADGTVDLRFNHQGYYRLLGIDHDQPRIPYVKILEAVCEEDREAALEELTRSAAELTPAVLEFRVLGPSGPRWIHIEAIPKSGADREVLAVWNAYGVDVTERKRLEAELAAAKELAETANRAKSEFLANMSHEIRTPMNAIIGLTHLALRRERDVRQIDYLHKIDTSARSLLRIINDILDFSKIEAGKLVLERARFEPESVLAQLRTILAVRATEKGLDFECRLSPTAPACVVGDSLRLGQILLNLAGNAIKFTERGRVLVSLREWASADADDAHCWLECMVADTGVGMTQAEQAHLFHSFSQADASTTRRFGGTGLGLAITRQLVEAMHGDIACESSPGHGTTFRVRVRLERAPDGAVVGDEPLGQSAALGLREGTLAGIRVLIVEDNVLNEQLARELLEEAGAEVSVARDGLQALALAETARFDVVFMDLQMPLLDGISAAQEMRVRGHAMPIIAMTASAMPGDRERCMRSGMNDYLAKPVNIVEFARSLGAALGRDAESLLAPARVVEDGRPDPEGTVDELLRQLDAQLAAHDSEATDCAEQLVQLLRRDVGDPLPVDGFMRLVRSYRFADARAELGRLRDALGVLT